jgi:DNA processing protein
LFWQLFLAAELPAAKSRVLLEGVGSSLLDPVDYLRTFRGFSTAERKRVEASERVDLEAVLKSGADVFTEDRFSAVAMEASEWLPPALFVKGRPDALHHPTVGIVGTRSATAYGRACAQKFAESLARAGVTIVSGGALGIDAAAHLGALAVGGATVAVLAGGIEHTYPTVHRAMFRDICENGCLVSQFAVGSMLREDKFLARNVTIAALCQALLVVQAPTRSGALSTANATAEMGREVFVVPANIDGNHFRGSFNLIRDGATLVYHPDQILEALALRPGLEPELPPAEGIAALIVATLGMEPISAERIVEQTGFPAGDVLAELTMLELEGRVMRDPSGYLLKP